MQKWGIVLVAAGMVWLTGCGQKQAATTSPSAVSNSAISKVSRQSTAKGPWDATKTQQLASFMQSWGASMDQQYQAYTPTHSVTMNGYTYPKDFSQRKLTVNGTEMMAAYTVTGAQTADYNVVAIYSDTADTSKTTADHLYLFAYRQNQPVVLVTQSTAAEATFTPTQNQELTAGFEAVAAGQATAAASATSASSTSQAAAAAADSESTTQTPPTVAKDEDGISTEEAVAIYNAHSAAIYQSGQMSAVDPASTATTLTRGDGTTLSGGVTSDDVNDGLVFLFDQDGTQGLELEFFAVAGHRVTVMTQLGEAGQKRYVTFAR